VGSVDETPRLAGASHFLEHLLFKGTRTRTGYEIADAVDAVGGELNAFTSHEYTCYYARILAEQAQLAVELVCDVVLDAVVTAADVDTERTVILEEIAMRDDDPEDTLADAFAGAVFAGHPIAAPVIGSAETITSMSRAQVAGYYHRRYAPTKMVVAIAGGVDHGDARRPDDPVGRAVPRLEHHLHGRLGDVRGVRVHERLVHRGVERLPDLAVAHHAEPAEGALELLRDGDERSGEVTVLAGQLDVVQHRDERLPQGVHTALVSGEGLGLRPLHEPGVLLLEVVVGRL
jgi:hypothetical protein